MERSIQLFVSDAAFLSSLQFALTVEGFRIAAGWGEGAPSCLIVDQGCEGDGLGVLAKLRTGGCTAPAILLATHPTKFVRERAAALRATILEKPLFGDTLTGLLRRILECSEAA